MSAARSEMEEFAGMLQRDSGGFVLQADGGQCYRLALLRTPVDGVEKRVIVTGHILAANPSDEIVIEAEGIRLA